jgi:hypothetical protein
MCPQFTKGLTVDLKKQFNVRKVIFTKEELSLFLLQGKVVELAGQKVRWDSALPEGTTVTQVNMDEGYVTCYVEHESFEPVSIGDKIPLHNISISIVKNEEA